MYINHSSLWWKTVETLETNHLITYSVSPTWFFCFCFCLLSFAAALCRISVPRPGTEPGLQRWKLWILTTRPPGNSLTHMSEALWTSITNAVLKAYLASSFPAISIPPHEITRIKVLTFSRPLIQGEFFKEVIMNLYHF